MGQNYTFVFYAKNHQDIKISNYKLYYWLVICIANNNFKGDFLNMQMFLHPQIPDVQILSKPYINGNMIYSAFRWCITLSFTKLNLKTVFEL